MVLKKYFEIEFSHFSRENAQPFFWVFDWRLAEGTPPQVQIRGFSTLYETGSAVQQARGALGCDFQWIYSHIWPCCVFFVTVFVSSPCIHHSPSCLTKMIFVLAIRIGLPWFALRNNGQAVQDLPGGNGDCTIALINRSRSCLWNCRVATLRAVARSNCCYSK